MKTIDKLIKILCDERGETVPPLSEEQKPDYFRALCNIRPPLPVSAGFLALQNEYLTERKNERGIVSVNKLLFVDGISLFRGDITTLDADAIVNAGNSAMLGCFHPLHNCIDNAIHSAAGVQVRLDCNDVMKGQNIENGKVIVTKGYNLPSKFIFHTVGPIVRGRVTKQNECDLENCYLESLKKADEMQLKSIAFCCISTGVFGYPKEEASKIAVRTVRDYLMKTDSGLKIVFNVFTEDDYAIYRRLLKQN